MASKLPVYLAVAMCTGLLSAPATAVTLQNAVFHEEYYLTGNCTVSPCDPLSASGTSDAIPESISGDWSSDVGQAVVNINTFGGPAPMVDIQSSAMADAPYYASVLSGIAKIEYSFAVVDKLNPDSVVEPVDIWVEARGSISLTAPGGEFDDQPGAVLRASVESWLYVDGYIGFQNVNIGTISGCGNNPFCTVASGITPTVQQQVTLMSGGSYSGYVYATVRNDGGNGQTYEAQVVADPVISFANPDDALRYDIIFSPNIGSTVPIPASVWLFGSGLLGLIAISRRKKVT